MSQKIYALLVGINDYDDEVGKLKGCVNDVDRFHNYLSDTLGKKNLFAEVLKNEDATHANITKMFRSHLGKAKKGDVALFQYSGHGAQWASAEAFWEFYPDRKDEGLVCIDSRRKGGYDLADKELAVLISEVAANEPHLAILFDCCHSGSGTRGVDDFINRVARQTHARDDVRPLETYIGGYYEKLKKKGEQLAIPASPHILLAACERVQKAWERRDNSGVFTSALMDVLEKSGSNISYADLFVRCRHAVRRYADDQNPQFEAVANFDAYSGFLGQDVSVQRKGFFVHFDQSKWVVDFGALHGAPSEPEKSVGFAIFPENNRSKSVGTASTTLVGPQQSEVKLDFQASPKESYWAEITSLPVPPIPVFLEGEEKGTKILQDALDPNIGIVLLTDKADAEAAQYALVAEKQLFKFINRETSALIQGIDGYSVPNARRLYGVIKQVVQWERGLALQNKSTKLKQSEVDYQFFELLDDGTEHPYPGDKVTLDFVKSGDAWKKIRFKLKARNQTGEQLYFTLAYFSRKYGVSILKNDPIPPAKSGEFVTLFGESPNHALGLKDDADESIDTFKLIVSRKQVDDFLLMQKDIDLGKIMPSTRDLFGDEDEEEERGKYEDDWFTKTIRVRTVRQLDVVGKRDTALADGKIKVKAHPAVKAKLSLSTAKTGTRAAGSGGEIYKVLERQGMQLASLSTGTRAAGDEQGILELTDIENDAALKDNPLQIDLDIPLDKNEFIMPITFDGEHILIGGDAYKDDAGTTHLSIDHIPEAPDNRRSVGKALKLYFFKTYLKQEDVNLLRWVEFQADSSIKQHKTGVKEKVFKAKNILLLIHGIIGDTEPAAKELKKVVDKKGKSIDQKFDLVLTYDYENLSTPIEQTAAKLKEQLDGVGLNENDGKKLTILAHSMGGLVSRWFIEQDGGNKVTDHLVMCGTPNEGSPFGRVDFVRKLMTLLTTVAMNTFPVLAPFGGVVLAVLNRSKKITPTLEQMGAKSSFMKRLNKSDDPGVQYTILAGDVEHYVDPADKLFPHLLEKTGKSMIFEAMFKNEAHDMAASIDSIRSVDDSRKPAPNKVIVPCHHINYFSSEVGIEALGKVNW